jgi:spore coat protein CotH
MKFIVTFILVVFNTVLAMAQSLPNQWRLDQVNHRMIQGGLPDMGLYNPDVIKDYYLEFSQSNYWSLLTNAYGSENYIEATLIVDGVIYPQVGVAFKGQTSYLMVQGEDKKSFSIVTDAFISGQSLEGYSNFNLNNCFDDPSFMKEFFMYNVIDKYIPAARCAYVQLYINGVSWGLYPSVQQLNKDFLEEWYLSNDGTNWRADAPAGAMGGGGGGGPQWGDGTAAFNYLGDSASDYDAYYTLKTTNELDPWTPLIETCDVLNNSSDADLPGLLPNVLDIDRTLWFLAIENAFADDDSYIYKGKMDYFCYWEIETGRMVPHEYDGNSILADNHLSWSPFYHADDVDYPLLNKLLNIPIWRQRYLAHVRTIIDEVFDAVTSENFINAYGAIIDPLVQQDTKKLYSYSQFTNGLSDLIDALTVRRNTIMANAEVNTVGASIQQVTMSSAAGLWINPVEGEQAVISAAVDSPEGIFLVNVYFSNQLVGNFSLLPMNDNGVNGDATANDGIFSAELPPLSAGEFMKFYIEAQENNTAKTTTYHPAGAEHDVYYFSIAPAYANNSDVVINELLAKNINDATDEASEFEDWIELYNKGLEAVNLSGFHLTDNQWNLDKWEIPSGTSLAPNEYLIIWADNDMEQGPLHANFKLSGSGESLTLINAEGQIVDEVIFGAQQADMAYARSPNGTGGFVIQQSTFAYNNNNISVEEGTQTVAWSMYPNPSQTELTVVLNASQSHSDVIICDISGREVYREASAGRKYLSISTSALADGTYVLLVQNKLGFEAARLVLQH